ncbi:hypothetical protein ACFCT7_06300 [Fulvivirgaceae bacterium LMO-SS25]
MRSITKIEQLKKSAITLAALFTAVFIIVVQPASIIAISANSHLQDSTQSTDDDSNSEGNEEIQVSSYEATVPVLKQLNKNQEVSLLWESPLQEKKIVWTEVLTPEPIVRFSKVLFRRIISPNAP